MSLLYVFNLEVQGPSLTTELNIVAIRDISTNESRDSAYHSERQHQFRVCSLNVDNIRDLLRDSESIPMDIPCGSPSGVPDLSYGHCSVPG